jgi:hypothetical protein
MQEKIEPAVYRATKTIYQDFIKDLKEVGLDRAKTSLQQRTPPAILTKVIRIIYRRAALIGARMTYTDLQKRAKEEKKAFGFGRAQQWVAAVLDYLNLNLLEAVQGITETVRDDINRVLARVTEGEWTINQVVKALQTTTMPRARARVIARTELVTAMNFGHAEGAKSFPFEVNKKWIAGRDHRVRHSHRLINGNIVDENSTFEVAIYKNNKPTGATERMLQPGDPKATLANRVNCRCRIVHEPKLDANGNYIERQQNTAVVIPLRPPAGQVFPLQAVTAIRKALQEAVFVDVKKT